MKEPFKGGVIFDFDGVLADTEYTAMKILERYATWKKVAIPSIDFLRNHHASEIFHALNIHWWELPYTAYLSRKWAVEENPIARLHPWASFLITSAREAFENTWVVSSNSKKRIQLAFENANINFDPDKIFAGIGFFNKARHIKRIINIHKISPHSLIYVGDEARDIEASKNAGVRCLCVTWGFQSKTLLSSMHPEYLLEDPYQFDKLLVCIKHDLCDQ